MSAEVKAELKPHHVADRFSLFCGDCRDVMCLLDDCSVDAIVTDPPYELTSNKKGGTGIASVNLDSPYGRARITTGFMGKAWDGTGVPFMVETWIEARRVLKPGGHLLAFGGSRTYHRLACAIEDAGFEIRDQIQWIYGSGFPKSLNVGRSIDSELCAVEGRHFWAEKALPKGDKAQRGDHVCDITPQGFEHNNEGTALKPAHEPIVLARKPLIGTVAQNILEHGTGGLNIDGCRIETGDDLNGGAYSQGTVTDGASGSMAGPLRNAIGSAYRQPTGRWPANVIHDGSDEVLAQFPEAEGNGHYPAQRGAGGVSTNGHSGQTGLAESRLQSGSTARFFYCAKATQEDREEGLEDLTARQQDESRKEGNPGGDNPRNRGLSLRKNHHPTVKPTDLMRYLCRLVTPPGGIVLDPFCGSGSTGKAAMLEGFKFVGIELNADYCQLAQRRIEAVTRQGLLFA